MEDVPKGYELIKGEVFSSFIWHEEVLLPNSIAAVEQLFHDLEDVNCVVGGGILKLEEGVAIEVNSSTQSRRSFSFFVRNDAVQRWREEDFFESTVALVTRNLNGDRVKPPYIHRLKRKVIHYDFDRHAFSFSGSHVKHPPVLLFGKQVTRKGISTGE